MQLGLEDKLFINYFRLELNERLKYIEKSFNNIIKDIKFIESYDNENFASYQIILNDNLKYRVKIKHDETFEIIREGVIINYSSLKKFNLISNNGFTEEYKDLYKIINGGLTIKILENIESILANGIQDNQNNQLDLFYTPGINRKMRLYLSEESIDDYKKRTKKSLELLEETRTKKLSEEIRKKKLSEDRNKRIKGEKIIISDGTDGKTYFALKIMD